jgi:4-hydroxy-3-methylbut-2-enyl diphosphate reductase
MRILLVNPRGFCAGVEMAIESVERALELCGTPLYVYHEIVHNKLVVDGLRSRGVVFVDEIEQVPAGSYLLYSAHGVSPHIRDVAHRRRLRTIDATCPLVTKVHREAVRYAKNGYTIVLIGHANHDETVGTMGEAPEYTHLIESVEDVDRLEVADPNRLVYLTQTTLSLDDAARIIERLKQRFPKIIGPPSEDICFATQNRQTAVKQWLHEVDIVLVVGSQNSSNSNRLVEIARDAGKPAYLIDSADDVELSWFRGDESILLTAGASAPESAVSACVNRLVDQFGARVEQRSLLEEKARFALPSELTELAAGFAANRSTNPVETVGRAV